MPACLPAYITRGINGGMSNKKVFLFYCLVTTYFAGKVVSKVHPGTL
jgi:hypothetical protein